MLEPGLEIDWIRACCCTKLSVPALMKRAGNFPNHETGESSSLRDGRQHPGAATSYSLQDPRIFSPFAIKMTSAEGTPLQEASGYDRLGWLMGKYGDMSIFRRFGALSAETLLHKQAELQELEVKLREQQENDRASGHPDRQKYHRSWWLVHHSADSEAIEGNDPRQLELLTEIDAKVKKYRT